jgi:DNA-binding SARP family transcriptional activator
MVAPWWHSWQAGPSIDPDARLGGSRQTTRGRGVKIAAVAGLAIHLLGPLRVLRDGRPLALPAKKAQALLACLALRAGEPQPRAKLAALLWADADEGAARASLRQALLVLRRALALGDDALAGDADTVTLAAGAAEVDVQAFERLADDGGPQALEQAAALLRGELLDAFDARAPAFDEWLALERQRVRTRALAVLQRLLAVHMAAGRVEQAIDVGLRLLALDPLHEPVHRALMDLYARQGRHDAAARQFALCRELLRRELGQAPQPATLQLHEALAQRRAEPPPAAERPEPDAELRQVAIVGIEAAADEPDPERAHARASAFAARVHDAAARHGATLLGEPVFGASALLLFGAPRAHGDDVERAARCALAFGADLRVGLAAGTVLVTHTPFNVAGDVVAQATRLAARAAPGEVLASDAARRALREPDAGPADTLPQAWRLRALRGTADAPLIGRRLELAQFTQALDAVRAGGAGLWLHLRGEPGIGKTRLVEAFRAHAAAAGFAAHRGAVLDFGGERDALAEVVASLLDGPAGAPPDAVLAAALAAGRADAADEPQLRALLQLPQPPAAHALQDALDAATRERRRAEALTRLLQQASAARPRLLVIEDLHWAPPATLAVVAALARACAGTRALLVTSARSDGDPLDAAWRAAAAGGPLLTLDLGPLRWAEASALAEQLGGAAGDDYTLRCIERAGGNPLFLEQLMRAQRDADAPLPASVRSVVAARLDRLDGAERRLLRAASVLGQRFALAALAEALGEPLRDTRPAHGLLRIDGDEGMFAHALVHEAVYASLPQAQRRELHARAAAWYAGRDASLRAEHLDRAGDARAPAAYLDAAREQAAQHRAERALQLAERGLALAGDDIRAALAACRAELLHDAGAVRESQAAWQLALDAAADDRARGRAWLGLAATRRVLDDLAGAAAALDEAERLAGASGDGEALARAPLLRGNLLFPQGDLAGCLREHKRSLQLARRAHSIEIEAAAQGGIGDAEYLRGRMRSAMARYRDCVELARRHGCARIEVANRPMLGWTRWFGSDEGGALAECTRAIDDALRIGQRRAEMIARHGAYQCAFALGDLAQATLHAERSLELARQLDAPRFVAEGLAFRGEARIAAGDGKAGRADLREALAIASASGMAFMGPTFLGMLAAATDDDAERTAALAEGEALLHSQTVAHNQLLFRRAAIDVCLRIGDAQGARRHAEALDTFTRPEPLPWADFFVARARALAAGADLPPALREQGLRLGLTRWLPPPDQPSAAQG